MADAVKEFERRTFSIARPSVSKTPTAGPVILFTAGGVRFAVEAGEVQEVRDGDERTLLGKLKGTAAIDFALQVGLGEGILERLLVLKPGECALGVRDVERMADFPRVVPLPGVFRGAERQWYRGLLLLENEVVPLVRTDYWRKVAAAALGAAHE
jgi:hypothetical protein